MSVLPLSNIINVTISNTPQGITTKNVNSLGLFTTEQPSNIDQYRIYISASQVAEDYGSNSVTFDMATAIFAQTPNILSGNGRLVIIPLEQDSAGGAATSATAGNLQTADLSSTLTNILGVTNGDIRITIDSVNYDLTNLNFSNATTWADIVTILQRNLVAGKVTALANGFEIESKKVGTASTVAMASLSSGGTDLYGVGYFKGASASTTGGTNASGETLEAAILRTQGLVSYTGVISNLYMQDALVESTADFVQSQDIIFLNSCASIQDIAGIGADITDALDTHTRILVYTDGLEEANLMKAAYAGRGFSTNFNGSNTAGTMNLKQLATITPDLGINQTLYEEAKVDGTDLYVSYEGTPGILSTGANDFFDNVYANLALKYALQSAGFNYLAQTNTKVPQTQNGMNGLINAYAQVIERFIQNGTIAPGTWTSSETFGNPEIFRQNISQYGYYIYSTPIAQQDPVERAQRKAPLVQIAIKRAGAIHTSDVIVIVNP